MMVMGAQRPRRMSLYKIKRAFGHLARALARLGSQANDAPFDHR